MLKLFPLIFFVSLSLMQPAFSQVATAKQRAAIEKMTADQLYETYALQLVSGAAATVRQSGYSLSSKQQLYLKNCSKALIQQSFAPAEMRILFIQPANMDYAHFNQKIEALSQKIVQFCSPQVRQMQ